MLYLLVATLIALAVGALLVGLGQTLRPKSELDERLEDWVSEALTTGAAPDRRSAGLMARLDRRMGNQGLAATIRRDLGRADLSLTVPEYLLMRLGLVVVFFLGGYLFQRNLFIGLLAGIVGYVLPLVYLSSRRAKRLSAFNGQLPDVLDQLVGSLRIGYGLTQAVEWVANQIPPPAGTEFGRVVREMQLGWSLPEALNSMLHRVASDDLALIVAAIDIQYETGGGLAEVLETAAHTIRERVRIQREIRVLTAQQRYSGYVLMVMPIALGFVLMLLNPEYEMQLFAPGPTLCIPIGTGLMMIIGFLVMRRIVEIEV